MKKLKVRFARNENALVILGLCQREFRKARRINDWNEFRDEAMSGDYSHLLATVNEWFDVEHI